MRKTFGRLTIMGLRIAVLLLLFPLLSFAQYPKLTVLAGDTVICLKPFQLKTLNSQIALLIEHHTSCTATVKKADEVIESYKANEVDLKKMLANQQEITANKDKEIDNLIQQNKNTKKIWLRRLIGGTGGGVIVGVIAGILIVK